MERERGGKEERRAAFKLISGGFESLPNAPDDVRETSIKTEGRTEVEKKMCSPEDEGRLGILTISMSNNATEARTDKLNRSDGQATVNFWGGGHATLDDLAADVDADGGEMVRKKVFLVWIDVQIGEAEKIGALIDTGATMSCVSGMFYEKLQELNAIRGELPVQQVKLTMAVGCRKVEIKKQIVMEMSWEGETYMVVAFVVTGLFTAVVLGCNWLAEHKMVVDCGEGKVYKRNETGETLNVRKKDCGAELSMPEEKGNAVAVPVKDAFNKDEMLVSREQVDQLTSGLPRDGKNEQPVPNEVDMDDEQVGGMMVDRRSDDLVLGFASISTGVNRVKKEIYEAHGRKDHLNGWCSVKQKWREKKLG